MLHITLIHISPFVGFFFFFFASDLSVAVHFIFIFDCRYDIRRKAIQEIFSFKFKIGLKAAETNLNINNAFGPGTANEHTMQQSFKKFCKGNESLKDEKHSGQPSEIDNDQLRAIIKANPLPIAREVAKEHNMDYSMVIWHLKQIGKVKKVSKWVPHV